jgi:hypothetical protein
MADISDPQAVRFCNERVRPAADRFAQLYWWAKAVAAEWEAQGIAAKIPNDASVILDGAATDGRPIITGADVNTMAARVAEFIALLEATGSAKLSQILKVSVNSQR